VDLQPLSVHNYWYLDFSIHKFSTTSFYQEDRAEMMAYEEGKTLQLALPAVFASFHLELDWHCAAAECRVQVATSLIKLLVGEQDWKILRDWMYIRSWCERS